MEALRTEINIERIWGELQKLSTFNASELPAVTRVVYTKEDLAAREYIKGYCKEAGFTIREDGVGNTFIRFEGSEPELPAIGTGSHIDAIPNSGTFDGTVGVLGGIEAMRSLKESGFTPKRSLEVLLFTSEEPTRFGIGCLGSRLLSDRTPPSALDPLLDDEGMSIREACASAGFSGELESIPLAENYYHSFVELHIEQGPNLEKEQKQIGIVSAIAAPATLRIVFTGEGGHAGTVLMPIRKDALLGAAELALFVDQAARSSNSDDSVATTGVLKPHPGAVNSIPSSCMMEIDIRDTTEESRDGVINAIIGEANRIADRRKLYVKIETLNADPPVTCDANIIRATEQAVEELSFSSMSLVSRAYHDSLFIGQKFPTGMIFIPCKDGISHRPDESITADDLKAGILVLANVMKQLSLDV